MLISVFSIKFCKRRNILQTEFPDISLFIIMQNSKFFSLVARAAAELAL